MDPNLSMFWIAGILMTIVIAEKESRDDVVEIFRWSPRTNGTNVEREFVVIGKRVTWSVARVLCSAGDSTGSPNPEDPEDVNSNASKTQAARAANGRLAVLEDDNGKKWLARMLSESNYRYDGLWIGGHRTNSSLDWTWVGDNGNEEIAMTSSPFLANYPEWYRSKDRRSVERNCLVFDRIGHDLPTLVPTDCQLRKPFLCSRIARKKNPERIVEGGNVTVDGYRYAIFGVDDGEILENTSGVRKLNGGGVKWRDARLECRKRGQYLATVFSNEAASLIAGIMLKNRPSMESAWLGGWSADGTNWTWSPTGFKLSSTKSSVSQYPPWLKGHPVPISSSEDFYQRRARCLILDRHLCPEQISPVFLDLDCEKKRPFVCQDGIPKRADLETRPGPFSRSIRVDDKIFEFSAEQMTWIQGREHCEKNHGRIASVLDSETLSAVLDKMTELYLDHVWVGGRTKESAHGWRWFDETGKFLSRGGIGPGSSWCLGDDEGNWPKAEPDSCLNLDREGHGLPLFYGLPCDFAKQHVLCSTDRASKSLSDDSATLAEKNKKRKVQEISGQDDEDGRSSTQPEIEAEIPHQRIQDDSNGTLSEISDVTKLSTILEERIGDLARADRSGLLFVLDDDSNVLNAWLAEEIKFVAVVLRNLFPLSANHSMGLLTVSKIATSSLGLNQTDECAVLSHMQENILEKRRLYPSPNGHDASPASDDFIKAADAAADVATNSGLPRVAILFVLDGEHRTTSAENSSMERESLMEKLTGLRNSSHEVFSIFVGQSFKTSVGFTEFQKFFGDSASGKKNLYTVQSFAELSELVAKINSTTPRTNDDTQCTRYNFKV